jgi:hypothetical protein
MLLVGGIGAWRGELGSMPTILAPELQSSSLSLNSSSNAKNPFLNGTSTAFSTETPLLADSHQLWTPQSKAGTDSVPGGQHSQSPVDQSPRHFRCVTSDWDYGG